MTATAAHIRRRSPVDPAAAERARRAVSWTASSTASSCSPRSSSGIVAADIFISVLLRNFFATSIPDSYDFGRLLLGILIFWGIAATSYRGAHITVDLVWSAAARDGSASSTSSRRSCCCSWYGQTAMLFDKVRADPRRQCADLRSASADLAVLRGRLGRATSRPCC